MITNKYNDSPIMGGISEPRFSDSVTEIHKKRAILYMSNKYRFTCIKKGYSILQSCRVLHLGNLVRHEASRMALYILILVLIIIHIYSN